MLPRLMMAGKTTTVLLYDTPGTYTWTAPADITTVTKLTGRGGSGYVGSEWTSFVVWFYLTQGPYNFSASGMSLIGPTLTYDSVRAQAASMVTSWQSITTSSSGALYFSLPYNYQYHYVSGNWYSKTNTGSGRFRRTGSVAVADYFSSLSTATGNADPSLNNSLGSYATNVEKQETVNYTGGSSTALGQTFSGTTNTNPTVGTFNNISVTPGTTYTFVVGSSQTTPATGFIQIEF